MDRSAFDRLDMALTTNAKLVESMVALLDASVGADALLASYKALVRKYGRQAAQVALEFYVEQREAASVEEPYDARAYHPWDDLKLSGDVAEAMARSSSPEMVSCNLAARATQRTMEYADETIGRNAALDPARPRWAIVPHPGACAWCVTLGSFGFTYASESTARGARHPSCRCTPAVDFDRGNPSLDGYDPDSMYDAYRKCQDTVRDDAERRWAAMSDEERSRYTSAGRVHKDGTRGPRRVDYQAYLKSRTVKEMGRRDRGWLQGGKIETDYSLNPIKNYGTLKVAGDYSPSNIVNQGNEWRDLWAHHVLEQNGFLAQTHGKNDIDLTINGEWWEVKSPKPVQDGHNLRFIEKALRVAKRQFDERGIPGSCRVVFNSFYREPVDEDVMALELSIRAAQHGVVEVLYVSRAGNLRRIVPKQ